MGLDNIAKAAMTKQRTNYKPGAGFCSKCEVIIRYSGPLCRKCKPKKRPKKMK